MLARLVNTRKSRHTAQSVRMLQNSPEYKHFMAVKHQGESFGTMVLVGIVIFFIILYADFMANLVKHTPFVGGAMDVVPQWARPLLLAVVFIASAWVHTGSWSPVYDDASRIVGVGA